MSELIDDVKSWFHEDSDYLYDSELEFFTEGEELELPSAPDGVSIKLIQVNLDRDYDSYGNRYLSDGYIVFSVESPEEEIEKFKLPVKYFSYEGWEYCIDKIAPTSLQEKVITVWEWV